jgi:PAS domain S-box-containing protein
MHSKRHPGTTLRILTVCPSAEDPILFARELEQAGFDTRFESAAGIEEFRRMAAATAYDLVLCAPAFPGWTFQEGLAALKGAQRETPLIVMMEEAREAIDLGAFDCIQKDRLYRLSLAAKRIVAERTLREAVETMSAAIEASPLAIVSVDCDGGVRLWNPGAEEMFGWEEHEVVGRPSPVALDSHSVRRDGAPLDISVWSAALRGPQGEENGRVSVIADVTESKRATREHQRLLEQERFARTEAHSATRFRKLLESAPDAIFEVDGDGRIVLANLEAERLFGYHRDELVGQRIESLIPARFHSRHFGHRDGYSQRPTTRPMGTGLDLFAVRKDGTEFAVDINLSPFEDAEGKHVICIVRDVSERRRADEKIRLLNQSLEKRTEDLAVANRELELRNREVERANRLKSEFLASMSHELRTPLNAIIGFSDLLGEQTAKVLTDKQKRFLGHIHQGARHLLELINDILDLSKIEAGRLELRYENFTMAIAVAEVLSSVRPLATNKTIALESSLPMDVFLNADRVRFKEVLYNLFSNAIKFTPKGGRIWIESYMQGPMLTTVVGDTGVGIPAEEHESIFESFHQVGATTKGVKEGTGLGLAITRRLIEQHGGQIWLESEPGAGSRFHFTLPLLGPGAPAIPAPASSPNGARRERALVLVVEDDHSSQELIVSYLESAGYLTVTAGSGPEAIRQAKELKPDVITLDMMLPGKNGYETLHELRNIPATSEIPVVIVSVVDDRSLGFAVGATEYLVKPVSKDSLLDVVRKYVQVADAKPVLVVDDEDGSLQLVTQALKDAGYGTLQARGGAEALEILDKTPVGAMVLDLMMPVMNGFEVIQHVHGRADLAKLPILVLTAKDLNASEVELLKGKVSAYLPKGATWKSLLLDRLRVLVAPAKI